MKTKALKSIGMAVILLSFIFTGCEEQAAIDEFDNVNLTSETDSPDADSTTSDVYGMLKYMREEEKLAHDVYVNMFELWDAKVFEYISKSESKHTESVKGLLDYFRIEDPALPSEGKFTNQELQELYNTLVAKGQSSFVDALLVGATIEEVDIIDLDTAMKNCDVDTILTVYANLRKGSTHHLKAFVYNLSKQGFDYKPQYLTRDEYDEIINSSDSVDENGKCIDTTNVGTITEKEAEGLLWMREEEKLAHDVYVNMFKLWDVKTFDNISKSETKHTESVLNLINLFGLEDPALPGIGEFKNEELQKLYDELMTKGEESLISGLLVGATIEEVDILDLEERMDEAENEAVLKVYSSLERGSEAHLRAFVLQLKNRGIDYKPQYLSQEAFDEIMEGN